MRSLLLCVVAATLSSARAGAEDVPDFNQHVAPIFKKYCLGCHNADDREGELVLDRYDRVLEGGQHGAAIMPGKGDASRLIQVLSGKAKPAMPPEDNEKPTAAEIALLTAWVNAGAKGPSGAAPDPNLLVTPKIKPAGPVAEPIAAVAFSPSGNEYAIARYGSLELRQSSGGALVRKFDGLRGRVNAMSFSANGNRLLAAAGEPGVFGEARLWNVSDAGLVKAFTGHKDSLYAAVLSTDGKLLATGSYDQQIKLWDVDQGKEIKTLSGHNDAVFDLAFRTGGRVLASASGDRTVKLWSVDSGERLDTLGQSLKELYTLAFSPDGKGLVAGGLDNRIRLWRISEEAKENTSPLVISRFAHEGAILKLVYSPDGRTVVSSAEDRTIKIWDADMLNERLAIEQQPDWASALAVSPDNKRLLVGRLDGTLALYDLATGAKIEMEGRASTGSGVGPVGSILAALALGNFADAPPPPKPELTTQSLRGLQRGVSSRIKLGGKNLANVAEVKTSDAKLSAKIMEGSAKAEEIEIELTQTADLARGKVEFWLASPGGESGKRVLYVDDLPQHVETEPNDLLAAATPVPLPSDVWGVLGVKGEVDNFAFEAKAGQTVVADVLAIGMGTKINPMVALFDAQGTAIAGQSAFDFGADPLIAFRIPTDGLYRLQINDLTRSGGPDQNYRLSISTAPYAITAYPWTTAAGKEAEVEISGFNLPAGIRLKLPAAAAGEIPLPLDANLYRTRKPLSVVVGAADEVAEAEPNDTPEKATPVKAPGTVSGRIFAGNSSQSDVDLFRFESKAGQTWIIETEAARRGSPLDTTLEVLHGTGQPVERMLLAATRDSYITFRGIDSGTRDCRVASWEEMELNELLYLNGEVVKLFRSPQGPDSGFLFYEGDAGKRKCYFDTSATTHALDEPCYIVEPRPLGVKGVSGGLPVFTLYYANDDEGQRRLGSDSRLTFTAPADGAYLVRVRDARGAFGERFAYRLAIREPKPDFDVSLGGASPSVDAGGGKSFTVSADRADGFDGDIRVDISGLPAGFQVSTPLVIEAGHREAKGVIFAAGDAAAPEVAAASGSVVKATAKVNGLEVSKPVNNLGQIMLAPKPKLLVRLEPADLTITPGSTVTATIKVQRNGHDDLVTFTVENLPHGVIVDNIGLNGVLLPKGELERQVFITAAPWVADTDRPCYALTPQAGSQASPPITLHVRKK